MKIIFTIALTLLCCLFPLACFAVEKYDTAYPDLIERSFEVLSIYRETPSTQPGKPGGGCNAPRFGILLAVCLLLMFCFSRVTKIKEKTDCFRRVSYCHATHAVLLLCIAGVVFAMLYFPWYGSNHFTLASASSNRAALIIRHLMLFYKSAAQEYIHEHVKESEHHKIFSSRTLSAIWDRNGSDSIVFIELAITPDATWIGYDLTEAYPIEPWWKEFWEGGAVNLEIRTRLAKIAPEFRLYGSESITTPPVWGDVNSLYKKEDNVIWLRVNLDHCKGGEAQ